MEGSFSSHKPLYFVFANEGETYYQDSMLQMRLEDYLWLELSKSDYKYIYFVNYASDEVTLKIQDADTYADYQSGKWTFLGKAEGYLGSTELKFPPGKLAKWIISQIGKKNGQRAFVFQLPAFHALFGEKGSRDSLEQLIRKQSSSKNPVILLSSMQVSQQEIDIFTDPNGVFGYRTAYQEYLCRELWEAIHSDSDIPIFQRLKEKLGSQFLELGGLRFESLKTLMRNVQFARDEFWTEEEFLDYTNFVYRWCYRPSMQKAYPGLFPEFLPGNLRSKTIYSSLTSVSGWQKFTERLNGYRKVHQGKPVYEADGYINKSELEAQCYVTRADAPLVQTASLQWPKLLGAYTGRVAPADFFQMQREILCPRNKPIQAARIGKLEQYIEFFYRAQKKQDSDTLRRAVCALIFCGKTLYGENEEIGRFLDLHGRCLTFSEQYFDIRKTLQSQSGIEGQIAEDYKLALAAQAEKRSSILCTLDTLLSVTPDMLIHETNDYEDVVETIDELMNSGAKKAEFSMEWLDDIDPEEAEALLWKNAHTH